MNWEWVILTSLLELNDPGSQQTIPQIIPTNNPNRQSQHLPQSLHIWRSDRWRQVQQLLIWTCLITSIILVRYCGGGLSVFVRYCGGGLYVLIRHSGGGLSVLVRQSGGGLSVFRHMHCCFYLVTWLVWLRCGCADLRLRYYIASENQRGKLVWFARVSTLISPKKSLRKTYSKHLCHKRNIWKVKWAILSWENSSFKELSIYPEWSSKDFWVWSRSKLLVYWP